MNSRMKCTSFAGLVEELFTRRQLVLSALVDCEQIAGYTRREILQQTENRDPLDAVWPLLFHLGHASGSGGLSWQYLGQGLRHMHGEDRGDEAYMRSCYERDLSNLRDGFWKLREFSRRICATTEYGIYIPDSVRGWLNDHRLQDYCIRVSEEDPSMWLYTPDEAYGRADRQVRMRPGKMLKKLLPDVADTVVQEVATRYTQGTKPYKAKFARTAADIVYVYTTGPRSCMSDSAGDFDKQDDCWPGCEGHHPVEAYAGPDTAVAYITDDKERITARAVVNTVKKLYGRVYGNIEGLKPALTREGYECVDWETALMGVRLTAVKLSHGDVLCPYIDGIASGRLSECGEYLVLDPKGDLGVQRTNGRIYMNDEDYYIEHFGHENRDEVECEVCGDYEDRDDTATVHGYDYVCSHCIDHRFTFGIVAAVRNGCPIEDHIHEDDGQYIEVLDAFVAQSVLDDSVQTDRLGIVYSQIEDEWLCRDNAVYVDGEDDWVSEGTPTVECDDGTRQLQDDCTLLYDGSWAYKADIVELCEYSKHAGASARTEDCVPALGADNVNAWAWVLADEVVEFHGMQFYQRDCVLTYTDGAVAWTPKIAVAAEKTPEGFFMLAPLDQPWIDEAGHPLFAPQPKVETESEMLEAA